MKVLHNGTFICALDDLKAGIQCRMFALVYSLDESTLVARSPSQSVLFFTVEMDSCMLDYCMFNDVHRCNFFLRF